MNKPGRVSCRTKVATVHAHGDGIKPADLERAIAPWRDRGGDPRIRTNSRGDVCIFVYNWTA